jgi:hypothetical protein
VTNTIQLAAKFYEARDSAKGIFGDEWPAKFAEYSGYIKVAMTKTGLDEMQATLGIMKRLQANHAGALAQMLVLAACVEMIEPSEEPR